MERSYNYQNLAGAGTTTVLSRIGILGQIIINNPVASGTITLYDNTAASGTKIGTITLPATVNAPGASFEYNITCSTGLTIVTTGTGIDVTVTFIP